MQQLTTKGTYQIKETGHTHSLMHTNYNNTFRIKRIVREFLLISFYSLKSMSIACWQGKDFWSKRLPLKYSIT